MHGVPAGNIRSPVANDALAAAGANALNEEQEVHKKAGRNGKHTGRDQVHVGVQQRGCAHGKKHSHKQQQIGVRGGKQQHGCAPQKGIQQHGLAAAQNIHPEAADGQKHEVADVAYGDDLGQLGGTQLEVGREDRGKNAPHGIVRAQTHHQDQERGKSRHPSAGIVSQNPSPVRDLSSAEHPQRLHGSVRRRTRTGNHINGRRQVPLRKDLLHSAQRRPLRPEAPGKADRQISHQYETDYLQQHDHRLPHGTGSSFGCGTG